MKYLNICLFLLVVCVAACLADVPESLDVGVSAVDQRKTEKRGIYGFGFGHGGYGGYGGHGGYGGFGYGGYGGHGFGGNYGGYPHYSGYSFHTPYYGHGHGHDFYPYQGYYH